MTHLKTFLLLITALAGGTVAAKAADKAAYRLNVQDFVSLTVVDGISVEYYCSGDSAGWAVFCCEPELASKIMFSNNAEHLTVRTAAEDEPIAGMPVVKVYSSALRNVENSGDSLVTVNMNCPVESFKAKQIGNGRLVVNNVDAKSADAGITAGNGTLKISGKAGKAKLSNVSTGLVDAADLLADNINCFIFGTGNIECTPSNNLRIYGAGSGKVLYNGAPVKISNRGLGVKALCTDSLTADTPQ